MTDAKLESRVADLIEWGCSPYEARLRAENERLIADRGPRYWVVLANGTLLDDVSEEQYLRLSNGGETIDGGPAA